MQFLTLDLEVDYSLIGIHSAEEDYRLAFLLNQQLKTKFNRFKADLDFENSNAVFSVFEFIDEKTFVNYYLISNKYTENIQNNENVGLFGGEFSTTTYLIQEKKKVDYFLKIEGCSTTKFIQKTVDKLNTVNQIITSYSIDPNNLKTKEYLIF